MTSTTAGAVMGEGVDAGIPAHYGSPFAEQRALAEGIGFVDRSHRGVLRVAGEDRWSWLHSLTTQHVEQLGDWRGAQTLILSPHGHAEHHLLLADDGEATWIDVEPGTQTDLVSYLEKMRFMLRVEPADVTDRWAIISLVGPSMDRALAALNVELAPDEWAVSPIADGGWARRSPAFAGDPEPIPVVDLLVPRDQREQVIAQLREAGITPAGSQAYEALRVAARSPRLGLDTDHKTLVQEVDWVPSAVHLKKGCYRGQETVAKVQNVGQRPRRLVLLHLDGSSDQLPAQGTPVLLEDRQIGFTGTAVRHYELGNVALAIVKRTTPDDADLRVGSSRVTIDPAP